MGMLAPSTWFQWSMAGSLMLYREASSSCLSLNGFLWREVVVQGLPGFSSIEAAGKTKARELSGGFHYKLTRVARWSPHHAGTGSSHGKLAAV